MRSIYKLVKFSTLFYQSSGHSINGNLITNGDHTKDSGNEAIVSKQAELVSFGKLFIANPDLPYRLQHDADFNEPNPKTFYGRGTDGAEIDYIDYPVISKCQNCLRACSDVIKVF